MRRLKKIITLSAVSLIATSSIANAQDDVSIMDLKETVYLLMKDVQGMKARQESFVKNGKEMVSKNGVAIKSVQNDVSEIEKQIKKDRNRDVLEGYTVSSELKNFVKNN